MTVVSDLNSCTIDDKIAIRRDSSRPLDLRDAAYEERFDWKTIFYDVYKSERWTVLQGPPLVNLADHVLNSSFVKHYLEKPDSFLINRDKGTEIWLQGASEQFALETALGRFEIKSQPDLSPMFEGRRVLFTLSKNNRISWIIDWVNFHKKAHGADALLLYDNDSDAYNVGELDTELTRRFPDMSIAIVRWPYKYGPQGGNAAKVNGRDPAWDSDFCQEGAMQHARFRFLQRARSVLNSDIDELVISPRGRSIFRAVEYSLLGVVHFPGLWVSTVASLENLDERRHMDYTILNNRGCPPKWAAVPRRCPRAQATWTAHAVAQRSNIFTRTNRFAYRHFRAITDNWKYDRFTEKQRPGEPSFTEDAVLKEAMARIF